MKDEVNNTKPEARSENMSEGTREDHAFAAIHNLTSHAHNELKAEGVMTSYVVIGFHELPETDENEQMFAKTITIVDRVKDRGPQTALQQMRDGNTVTGAATFVKNHRLTETLLEMALSEAVGKVEQLRGMEAVAFIAMLAEMTGEQDKTSQEED